MRTFALALSGLLAASGTALQQTQGVLDGFGQTPVRGKQYVEYAAESETVAAGRPATLELRFHVREGFHVNSHQPKSELLTATALSLTPDNGARLSGAPAYPAGRPYAIGSSDSLDVYTEDFIVRVPVEAAAGAHQLSGELLYQACDRDACYPPKKLPLQILFTAK